MKWKNGRGFTLVEILASLTILGIIFISFMMIFPQMSNMNERTAAKLETMNVAKRVLVEIKGPPISLDFSKKDDGENNIDFELYRWEEDGYSVEVKCFKTDSQNCSNAKKADLHKININVQKGGKLNSETFGYIQLP